MQIQSLISIREAAAVLGGISERNLWSLTAPRGPIPCVRIGRRVLYRPADLVHYAEQHTVKHRTTKARRAHEAGSTTT